MDIKNIYILKKINLLSANVNNLTKGFTLVELLVVIALIAVLAAVVILTLNPAELLRQGRDATRISDLRSISSALNLYLSDVNTSTWNLLDRCYTHATAITTCNNRFSSTSLTAVVTSSQNVNGTGWLPVNLRAISIGSPLPRYPIDPVNNSTFYYAFRPSSTYGFYEVNAVLESNRFLPNAQNDGGNSTSTYEIGSDLNL